MNMQEKIRKDLKDAMMSGDSQKKEFLRVVIGEMNRVGKELTDQQVVAVLKKMKKNAEEMKNDFEVRVLDSYLPEMVSGDELEKLVRDVVEMNGFDSVKDMGRVMKKVKELTGGNVDMGEASGIVKRCLK